MLRARFNHGSVSPNRGGIRIAQGEANRRIEPDRATLGK